MEGDILLKNLALFKRTINCFLINLMVFKEGVFSAQHNNFTNFKKVWLGVQSRKANQ